MATYDVTTNREDLANEVYKISPSDTPFMTAVPRTKATAVLHEWSTQALGSINTTNARLEGDALTRASSTAPARKQNYCQISSKDATVTGTERAVNPAGIDDMMAYQMSLKSLELRKDMEAILLGNTGQNALAQVRAFDDALQLTGLIVTKLDGTAKGGVLAAIARERPVPVYFIGVGEQLADLETFNAREFAQALLS